MGAGLAAIFFLLLAFAVCVVASGLPKRLAWLPVVLVALVLALLFFELARFDHGYEDALFVLGFLVAPLGLILAASLWGSRRFYGWPDLGPHPGRVTILCLAVLVGVLVGTNRKREDVAASQQTAESIRTQVLAWRDTHEGRWPANLEDVVVPLPVTSLGVLGPPAYEFGVRQEDARISFLASSSLRLVLDLDTGTWREERR